MIGLHTEYMTCKKKIKKINNKKCIVLLQSQPLQPEIIFSLNLKVVSAKLLDPRQAVAKDGIIVQNVCRSCSLF